MANNSSEETEGLPDIDNLAIQEGKRSEKPKKPKVPKPNFPKGNVIFAAMSPHEAFRSLVHRDFRIIVDYLRLYRNPRASQESSREFRARMVRGIQINCDGLVQRHEIPRFEECWFPQDHPIFQHEDEDCLAIPQVIGKMGPFRMNSLPPTKCQRKWFHKNPIATRMLTHLEPGSPEWGLVGIVVGSVQVVRADRKPLNMSVVEDLVTWMESKEDKILRLGRRSQAEQQKFLVETREEWLKAHRAMVEARKNPKPKKRKADAMEEDTNSKEADAMEEDADSKEAGEGNESEPHEDVNELTELDGELDEKSDEEPDQKPDEESDKESNEEPDEEKYLTPSEDIEMPSEHDEEDLASQNADEENPEHDEDTDMDSEHDNSPTKDNDTSSITEHLPTPQSEQSNQDIDTDASSASDECPEISFEQEFEDIEMSPLPNYFTNPDDDDNLGLDNIDMLMDEIDQQQ